MEASAVCQYNISELQRAFEGPYMQYQDTTRKWTRYDGEVPDPRPGSVSDLETPVPPVGLQTCPRASSPGGIGEGPRRPRCWSQLCC